MYQRLSNFWSNRMRFTVPTIYAGALATARELNIPYEVLPYTTINQAIDDPIIVPFQPSVITYGSEVYDDYDPDNDTKLFESKVFIIGNGGHQVVSGPVGGIPVVNAIAHRATDAGLYKMIPFIARPVTNDLTALERQKYRLRKVITISGNLYAVYFGRVIDLSTASPDMTLITDVAGTEVVTSFIPTINNLRPTPPVAGSQPSGNYTDVSTPVTVNFTATEVTELKQACLLMYGDENVAIISEISLCHGVDKQVTGRYPTSGTQVPAAVAPNTFFELASAQVSCHYVTFYPVSYTNNGFDLTLDLAVTEPLYGIENV